MKVMLQLALVVFLLCAPGLGQSPEDLDFLRGLSDFRNIGDMLPSYLKAAALVFLEERDQTIANLSSRTDLERRKLYVRERITKAVGGFPERTPLNPRVVGTLERENYRIEKVVFESQPGFYVVANLYLPKTGLPPYPAILYPLGHERGGKSYPVWQQMLGALAQKGYVALTWDPLGQGERTQIYDPDTRRSKVGGSTTQHTVLGTQCLLIGDNVSRYTIWDGIRALDYLLSRPEVDASRIGCTGNSGGGTHTAYLSALDDRIQVAAPSCYLTSWRRLLATIGPQDAEQNLPPWLADGLDHPDFVHAFAPKPYLILSAVRDFFSINGARSTYGEAQRIYALLGAESKIGMSEVDLGHGYHKGNRLAAYRWFGHWLKGVEDNEPEPEVIMAGAQELWVTETGQVATSLGGETVFSLNLKRQAEIERNLPGVSTAGDLVRYREHVGNEVRRLTGYASQVGSPEIVRYGEIERDGHSVEKLTYESEPGIIVPALIFRPKKDSQRKPAVLFVHGEGKSAGAEPGGPIEELTREGNLVLSVDLRGMGEAGAVNTRTGSAFETYFGQFESAMTALLIGRPLVGMRALDIVRGVDLLTHRPDVDVSKISVVGAGAAAIPVLHAAAVDDRIQEITLSEMLVSYEAVVKNPIHRLVFENVVQGVLKAYDLPDLVAALAPRRVTIEDALDPVGMHIRLRDTERAYAPAARIYETVGAPDNLSLR